MPPISITRGCNRSQLVLARREVEQLRSDARDARPFMGRHGLIFGVCAGLLGAAGAGFGTATFMPHATVIIAAAAGGTFVALATFGLLYQCFRGRDKVRAQFTNRTAALENLQQRLKNLAKLTPLTSAEVQLQGEIKDALSATRCNVFDRRNSRELAKTLGWTLFLELLFGDDVFVFNRGGNRNMKERNGDLDYMRV